VKFRMLCVLLLSPLLLGALLGQEKIDSSQHAVQMVKVEKDVSLEVLDWGGSGRPLVLLTGLGDNAHIFDEFAPKLTGSYHVYGVTRRGRGVSSRPESNETNYTAGRLSEDVLTVINSLRLDRPVIAGHSMAGEELSYIGLHHPEKVAGLIYIEAGYPYALYDQLHGELELDAIELRKQLRPLINGYAFEAMKDYSGVVANLQRVEKEMQRHQQDTKDLPPSPVSPRMTPDLFAIMEGRERFITIHAPALVIFATDPKPIPRDDLQSRTAEARQELLMRGKELQIEAFKRQVPSARLVLIPHGTHYVFQSNEAEVLREMNAFIAMLPPEQ
jgi:non-heme chloroperoxidase